MGHWNPAWSKSKPWIGLDGEGSLMLELVALLWITGGFRVLG